MFDLDLTPLRPATAEEIANTPEPIFHTAEEIAAYDVEADEQKWMTAGLWNEYVIDR